MNLLLLSNRRCGVRSMRFTAPQATAMVAGFSLLLIGAGFAAGLGISLAYRAEAETRVEALQAKLFEQQVGLAELEQTVSDTLDGLVARVGSMSAHVLRLDALGNRLTRMAGLEGGEFDFSEPPAMGGPESVMAAAFEPAAVSEREVVGELVSLKAQLDDRQRQLSALESMLLTRTVQERVEPAGLPVEGGWISSYYGRRTDPFTSNRAFHSGVDFAGREGMKVTAVADGVVTFASRRHGYGNLVEITHGNGLVTRYAHNKNNLVAPGDRVQKGQVIALMGATGRATGPNLHFEVLQNGRTVNPISYIKSGS